MKKIIFILSLIFLSFPGYTQYNIGIKGGITSSKLSTSLSDYNENTITGYYLGAFTRVYFNKFYLMPEAYFTSKGGDLTSMIETERHEIRVKSIDIPVLLGFQLLDLKVIKLSVDAGPVASIVTDKTYDYKMDGIKVIAEDIEDNFKNTNWGFQAGAKLDILMFMVEVKYEFGLNKIFDDNGNTLQNDVFLIGLGFKFL